MKPQFYAAIATDGTLELLIYGDIVDAATMSNLESWGYDTSGFVSSLNVKKALDSGSYRKIRVRINSPGGDAFEGVAIYNLLSTLGKPVDVFVDGIAASCASIVAMAGQTRMMGRSSMMMVHRASAVCIGNAGDMVKMSETLEKIDESIAAVYVDRTGMAVNDVLELMDAETWMAAQDCVEQGFATGIVELPSEQSKAAQAMARRFHSLARFRKTPKGLRKTDPASELSVEAAEDRLRKLVAR